MATKPNKKPVLISGIQPSGRLHIGNYLGALKNFVELQNSDQYNCLFFVADYHSLTESYDMEDKRKQIADLMASYLAAGLDPKKSTLFIQSHVSESTELAWVLSTIAPISELWRMTQFEDKAHRAAMHMVDKTLEIGARPRSDDGQGFSRKILANLEDHKEELRAAHETALEIREFGFANAGLFTYPILMAADILLYNVTIVPVGEDQLQHLEITRTLARRFNKRFGDTFIEPQAKLTKFQKIMSLDNPDKKMSKSQPKGCLFLDDSEEETQDKIMKSVTDSGNLISYGQGSAGVRNLLTIYSGVNDKSAGETEKIFNKSNYGEFKKAVASEVNKSLKTFRKNKADLSKKNKLVLSSFAAGDKKASAIASKKILEIKKKIGLI